METLLYSTLHMLVDGLCAFSMYAFFKGNEHWYLFVLMYNFCAFALQLVFGALMDLLQKLQEAGNLKKAENADLPVVCAGLGLLFTLAGAFIHPVVLGIGNALFHVGGGIGVIREDRLKRLKGQALGIFVAPGALGLYLGGYFAGKLTVASARGIVFIFAALFVAFYAPFVIGDKKPRKRSEKAEMHEKTLSERERNEPAVLIVAAIALAFIVVVLRSYAGTSISFSWKTGLVYGLACTLAVVLGKMAGGILSARVGTEVTIVSSLVLATYSYAHSTTPFFGIMALFFFNMTMPVTLYMVVRRLRDYPGFSFGLLTLALFLGFLPSYFGMTSRFTGSVRGAAVSIASLILLLLAVFLLKYARILSQPQKPAKKKEVPEKETEQEDEE